MNVDLPAAPKLRMQLIIDAYVSSGPILSNSNQGDIAIDDILVYASGSCSQSSGGCEPSQGHLVLIYTLSSALALFMVKHLRCYVLEQL